MLSNMCKTITLDITQKVLFFGQVVFPKNLWGTTSDGFTRKNVFKSFFEFFILKAVPQRCSTTKVFCKYAASLL